MLSTSRVESIHSSLWNVATHIYTCSHTCTHTHTKYQTKVIQSKIVSCPLWNLPPQHTASVWLPFSNDCNFLFNKRYAFHFTPSSKTKILYNYIQIESTQTHLVFMLIENELRTELPAIFPGQRLKNVCRRCWNVWDGN